MQIHGLVTTGNVRVIVLVISRVLQKTILFVYQPDKKRKNGGKIIYGFKSTLLKNKIEIELSIYEMTKLLNSFFWFSRSETKELTISGMVSNTKLVLLLSYLDRGIMGK